MDAKIIARLKEKRTNTGWSLSGVWLLSVFSVWRRHTPAWIQRRFAPSGQGRHAGCTGTGCYRHWGGYCQHLRQSRFGQRWCHPALNRVVVAFGQNPQQKLPALIIACPPGCRLYRNESSGCLSPVYQLPAITVYSFLILPPLNLR